MRMKSKETNEVIKFVTENYKKYTKREIVITMANKYKISERRVYHIIASTGLYKIKKRKKKHKVQYYEIDPRGAVEKVEFLELKKYLKNKKIEELERAKIFIDDSNLWSKA